jgi:hypothetical protein
MVQHRQRYRSRLLMAFEAMVIRGSGGDAAAPTRGSPPASTPAPTPAATPASSGRGASG